METFNPTQEHPQEPPSPAVTPSFIQTLIFLIPQSKLKILIIPCLPHKTLKLSYSDAFILIHRLPQVYVSVGALRVVRH